MIPVKQWQTFQARFTTKILTERANIAQEEQRFITFKAILVVRMRWRPAASLCKLMSLKWIKIQLATKCMWSNLGYFESTESNSFTERGRDRKNKGLEKKNKQTNKKDYFTFHYLNRHASMWAGILKFNIRNCFKLKGISVNHTSTSHIQHQCKLCLYFLSVVVIQSILPLWKY